MADDDRPPYAELSPEQLAELNDELAKLKPGFQKALREGLWYIPGLDHPVSLSPDDPPLTPEEAAAVRRMLGEEDDG